MLDVVLAAVVPGYFVLALGYLAGRTRDIDNHHVAALNALLMDLALPAAIFVAIVQTPGALLLERVYLVIVLAVSMLVIYALHFFLETSVFKSGAREAAVQSHTAGLPNFALALPLFDSVFGAGNTVAVGISIALGAIVISPLTVVILEATDQTAKDIPALSLIVRSIHRSLLKPIVLAPIAAVVISLFNAGLPRLLESSLNLIGICAAGVALVLTGLILSSQPFSLNRSVVSGTLLKNVVHPLLAVPLVMVLAAPSLIGRETIILCAVPAGFFGILSGLRYGVVSRDAVPTLIASSILSVITLAAAVVLTEGPQ
jgi:predicted permease